MGKFRTRLDAWVAGVRSTIQREMDEKLAALESQIADQCHYLEQQPARYMSRDAECQTLELPRRENETVADDNLNELMLLNVGGQAECAVSRKTLCQVEGS